ncbi:piggyBac transposable element-derived protein 4-like [Aricia agestis]|uniref:piggyBac transposable element-derived protein 4-like n=1 Tax=Aricia agestis TaxID=91739 RepID=UPI001C20C44A|nr:piggyBac transposable element-derived protein 4-like [Aricia agestis]
MNNQAELIRQILLEPDSEDDLLSDGSELEDHVSARSQDSGTEQDLSSDYDSEDDVPLSDLQFPNQRLPEEEQSDSQVTNLFFVGKDGTKWSKEPPVQQVRTRSENIIRQTSGVSQVAKLAQSELECWSLFFPESMLSIILTHTNLQIRERNTGCESIPHFKKEIDMPEFKAFIGLLYIAGFYRSGRQNTVDLWASDGTGVEIFRLTMSRQRFHYIQSCLRFDNKDTRDERKLLDNIAPIRQVFEMFVENCKQSYIPGEYVTIDEMLLAFRGRCKFRQYIPSKPAKYGVKILAMVDAKKFYILNLEIYAGKQPVGPFAVSNKPFDVVNRLVQPISKTGRNVTFDNWFTSFELVSHLLNEHKLTSVGTVRKNKRQIPKEFINTRSRNALIYSSKFGFQKDVTLVTHIPKKNKVVILMSSLHHDAAIDESTGEKRKPEINTFYNSTKGGVDVADELSATYDVSRNSRKWPLTVFYAMLNMAGINANIIHGSNTQAIQKRRNFIKTLGRMLVTEHLRARKEIPQLPRQLRKRIREFSGEPDEEPPIRVPGVRKRCQVCPYARHRKTSNVCEDCHKYICPEHTVSFCKDCATTAENNSV